MCGGGCLSSHRQAGRRQRRVPRFGARRAALPVSPYRRANPQTEILKSLNCDTRLIRRLQCAPTRRCANTARLPTWAHRRYLVGARRRAAHGRRPSCQQCHLVTLNSVLLSVSAAFGWRCSPRQRGEPTSPAWSAPLAARWPGANGRGAGTMWVICREQRPICRLLIHISPPTRWATPVPPFENRARRRSPCNGQKSAGRVTRTSPTGEMVRSRSPTNGR